MNVVEKLLNDSWYNELQFRCSLIIHLVKRDFYLQYKRSVLGILWSLIVPFAQLLVLNFIFSILLPLGIKGYGAFIFCALLPWTWFSNSISSSGNLFFANKDLVRKPNFQPYYLIIVNTLTHLTLFLFALPVLLIILLYYNIPISIYFLVFPILLLIEFILIIGLSLIISVLNINFSDINQIVTVLLMLLFYICPIFYGIETVGEKFRVFLNLNPLAILMEDYRQVLYYGEMPGIKNLLYTTCFSIITCIIGYRIYNHEVHKIIDKL